MARRRKSDGNSPGKPVNPVAVRKSTRQIARKQSIDGKKLNGEVTHVEVQSAPEEPSKPPEVVVKRKRGRPPKEPKNIVQKSKNVVQEEVIFPEDVNNVVNEDVGLETVQSSVKNDESDSTDARDVEIIPVEASLGEQDPIAIDEQVIPQDNETPPPDGQTSLQDDSVLEKVDSENDLDMKEEPEPHEMILENSQDVPPTEESWTAEEVIEETIICQEMEVETEEIEHTDYVEDESNVVLEQVLLMEEPHFEGDNVVYVIQNEDGTAMVMETPETDPGEDNYQDTSEYQVIEEGVECLRVEDPLTSTNCDEIIESEVKTEISEESGGSRDHTDPEKSVSCLVENEKIEKMIVDEAVIVEESLEVSEEHICTDNPDNNPSSNGLSPQHLPEAPRKIERRQSPRAAKAKLKKPQNSNFKSEEPALLPDKTDNCQSVDVLEDSGSSNLDSASTNPSTSPSEPLKSPQTEETLDQSPETNVLMDSLTTTPIEDSDNSNGTSTRSSTPSAKASKASEPLEELSRESEPELKPFEDQKFLSSSENSNDTVTLKCQEEKPSGEDPEKKLFRSRSGSTDTTGSESGSNSSGVRRSNRIRSQGLMKVRPRGRGLVTKPIADVTKALQQEREKLQPASTPDSQSETQSDKENSTKSLPSDVNAPLTPVTPGYDSDSTKPVKVKSRWRRSSELEMGGNTSRLGFNSVLNSSTSAPNVEALPSVPENSVSSSSVSSESESVKESRNSSPVPKPLQLAAVPEEADPELEGRLSQFEIIKENLYLTERYTNKETKRMTCDCFLTEEELERGEMGCGEDCLNRLLMIECGPRCNINDRCTNKRFQNCDYAKCEVFRTEKKGLGLRAVQDLEPGEFIMEYVGEVLDPRDFRRRAKEYSKDKNQHYYFMALKSDQIIDATIKGNISRFINHSCDPNAETQKWTVNGELRIGFFNRRFVAAGEEITFDYHFQRYGKEAQKCYCEAATCRGWIGDTPDEEQEKTEKKEKREREDKKKKREVKKSYMEDEDLEEEIDKLCSCGLKNRNHTLTLSRLMVRSREMHHRSRLLKVLQSGVEACRRLFLDYHGLRLIWSYMTDVAAIKGGEAQVFRLELVKTLNTLPIPNKTMLMDSKVFGVVEKWSQEIIESSPKSESPSDETNKPKTEDEVESNCDSNDKSVESKGSGKDSPIEKDGEGQGSPAESDNIRMIIDLALELLTKWSSLKEVFRIPKKERIEQMKEHEREADIGYKEDTQKEERRVSSGYDRRSSGYDRRDRRRGRESPDSESYRNKDKERSNLVPVRRLTKYERRQLFAMKVAKEEEERMRRQQQEAFQHHESKCVALGLDPIATPVIDPNTGYPLFFNPNLGQWQAYPVHEGEASGHDQMHLGHSQMHMGQSPGGMGPGINHNVHGSVHQVPGMPPDISPSISSSVYGPGMPTGFPPPGVSYPTMSQAQGQFVDGHLQMQNNLMSVHNGTPPTGTGVSRAFVEDSANEGVPGNVLTATPMETVGEEEGGTVQPDIPPLDLPPKWKCAKDPRGRYYYYHVKERVSQWLPPPPTHIGIQPETSSSEESTEESSSSDEDDDEEEDEWDDGEVVKVVEGERNKSRDPRIAGAGPEAKKRRDGLVQERIISPRREENRVDHKKYKDIKDKLRRQKERGKLKEHIDKMRKHRRANKAKSQARHTAIKLQAIAQSNELTAERKIKDSFRVNMATVIVKFLNPYRQNDCKQGRITNTEDFKYLARKLTHFVMAKELKHCKSVDELQCNENVKHKAKDFVRKYMSKFGPVYQRSSDDD
ncbi:probable histone-lysine N-methyltransferase CG1716 [Diachasmimorpha longicaudata]|uniref:probable histone-lysine N-methyltransferase CG1716 n=1 Tax=Diachasmimorpha longicaudata TaxID=58733 RepID=UPI0030B8FBFF